MGAQDPGRRPEGTLHPRLGIDHQLLTPVEFLALLVPHVLLKYEVTLRLAVAGIALRRWAEGPPARDRDTRPPLPGA